ncbi:hypothetical protein EMCRGX_G031052 [Ephydatia muelleri]
MWRVHAIVRPWASVSVRHYAKKGQKARSLLSEEEGSLVDLEKVTKSMTAAVSSLKWEYTNTVVSRVTPAIVEKLTVAVEGQQVPLGQLGQVGLLNPQTVVINLAGSPQSVDAVVQSLRGTSFNLNPVEENSVVKVPLPKMTKELRESLVKLAKAHAEKTKTNIRKARQKAIGDLRSVDDTSKDAVHRLEKHLQDLTDQYTDSVEELFKAKSTELMKS